jgi:NADH-quinone oxidoreductase subunit I
MGCGFCAEYCPFDAVKMDAFYELATYTRPGFINAMESVRSVSYHAQIHPTAYALELEKKVSKT